MIYYMYCSNIFFFRIFNLKLHWFVFINYNSDFAAWYRLNSKLTSILYNYNTEYTTKQNTLTNGIEFSLLVFYVTCNDISVIYETAQVCRLTEEAVPTVGLPIPETFRGVL